MHKIHLRYLKGNGVQIYNDELWKKIASGR